MKVMNLDGLAKVTKSATIRGQTYEIKEMSVEGFVAYTKLVEKMTKRAEGGESVPIEEQIDGMRQVIGYALPDCPKEVLATLTITQLTALSNFINDSLTDEDPASASVTETEAPGKS